MPAPSDPTDLLGPFLNAVEGRVHDLPDPFDEARSAQLPARLRGLVAECREKDDQIIRAFVQKHGAVTQECISLGKYNSTCLDSKLRELNREGETHRSHLKEDWYCGLSEENKTVFDKHCLAMAEPVFQRFFPPSLTTGLRGPVARLALEYAAISRRFATRQEQIQKSGSDRGLNHTVVKSILDGLTHDEKEAKAQLVGRWFRELTPEQAAEFDKNFLGRGRRKVADAKGTKSKAKAKPGHDRRMEERDKWIYQQCCQGRQVAYCQIVAELRRIAPEKNWERIESIQGIRTAASRYADRNQKPPIPNRQNL